MRTSRWFALLSCSMLASCASHRAGERPLADLAAGRMVRVSGGTFRMGAGSGPAGNIADFNSVGPFLLDVTEVTVSAYGACVKAGGCPPAPTTVRWEWIRDKDRARWSPLCNANLSDRGDHPINCVDWTQAVAYCAWAGKRLPTEQEWEWAARNGSEGTGFPWGDDPPLARACWNGEGNDAGRGSRQGTCPVGSHPAGDSRAGVKDLSGNVAEWTSSEDVVGADGRGRGGTPVKVARGGGWSDTEQPKISALARLLDLPSRRDAQLGFRCASDP
ncbi:MAG TPA: SUMF1/EgtB/PvdO family nonheme iron enzyme [Anaeromyxobacter sp.]|nr:SUMF1/EgtB/PvdO family nonheme iron enzyme [Anaeromyxobacter sp.]